MKIYSKLTSVTLVVLALVFSAVAQSPRSIDKTASTPKPPPAPQTVKAKYEGGVFGYNQKQEGTLNFDDVNNRLVFRNKIGKDVLFIPYTAISQAFADSQANRPKSASILGSVPVPYGINPIGWIKTKNPYVTLQFFDQDSHIGGITSFRVDSKEICASVVNTLADKAGLVARGEIFTRQGGVGPYGRGAMGSEMMVRVDVPDGPAVFVENEVLNNRVISLPRPVYPEEARQQKVAGIVRVLATVDENGSVAEAEAVSGSPLLQDAAVNAAKQAKFEPIGRAGRGARMKTIISYNFQLL